MAGQLRQQQCKGTAVWKALRGLTELFLSVPKGLCVQIFACGYFLRVDSKKRHFQVKGYEVLQGSCCIFSFLVLESL